MPLLTRTFIKTALVYFALSLLLGILLELNIGAGLFPVYIHLFVFGWLTQLIFGVAHWMFPKYSNELPRGREALGWASFAAMNAGLLLRAVAEPLQTLHANYAFGALLVLSAALQWLSGLMFVVNAWPRVKEK